MAREPIDCTGTVFESRQCAGCDDYVVVTQGFTGDPMCLACRRSAEGITWPNAVPLGEWHPTVGYPRAIPSMQALPVRESGWAWTCVRCLMNGPADSAQLAAHFSRMHDAFACPAVPWITPPERALRVGRRADMTRRYPDRAPAWPSSG